MQPPPPPPRFNPFNPARAPPKNTAQRGPQPYRAPEGLFTPVPRQPERAAREAGAQAGDKGHADPKFEGWDQKSEGVGGSEVWRRQGGAGNWPRSPTPSPSPEEDGRQDGVNDTLEILLAMGFHEADAREALERTSSLEAAVEFMMEQAPGSLSFEKAGGGWYGVMERIGGHIPSRGTLYGVAERVGERVTERVPAAGGEIYGAVRRLSEQLASWVPPLRSFGSLEHAQNLDIVKALLSLGYTDEQAHAAARRCSSVEAAVEWISAGKNIGVGR